MLVGLEPAALLARPFELAGVDLAHALHRVGRAARVRSLPDDGLDVAEAEAHLLELGDPPDAGERLRSVEPESPLGAGGRGQQPELLVEMESPHGLPRFTGQVPDLHQVFGRAMEGETEHGRTLTFQSYVHVRVVNLACRRGHRVRQATW